MSLHQFSQWLAATPASLTIQTHEWIVPAVQSVHILAVAVVVSTSLMLDLRLVGLLGRGQAISAFWGRYLPWTFIALVVLLLTGAVMITGEPGRSLENWVFWTKMATLLVALTVTLAFAAPMLADRDYWEHGARRALVRWLGAGAIVLWFAVVICGRWIAYVL